MAESRKRAFGTDVTNICFKRNKTECLNTADKSSLGNDSEQGSKSYQFGPFAPVTVAKNENNQTQVHDWESLASTYRPKYHNQGRI